MMTHQIAGLSSGDAMGLQNLADVQQAWFVFLLTVQQWECWKYAFFPMVSLAILIPSPITQDRETL